MKGNHDPRPVRTLRFGTALVQRSAMVVVLGLVFGLLVLLFLALLWILQGAAGEDQSLADMLARAWTEFTEDRANRWMLWALAVLVPAAAIYLWMQSRARLVLMDNGLRARIPPMPALSPLRQTDGRWTLNWSEIRSAHIAVPGRGGHHPQRLALTRLNLDTDRGQYSLFVWRWFDPEGEDHRLSLGELHRLRTLDFPELVKRTPLIRALEEAGITVDTSEGSPGSADRASDSTLGAEQFDLTSHRGMQIQLGVLAMAGGYALVDTFFLSSYQPLETLDPGPFVLAALIGAVIAAPLGRDAPRMERLGVGALVVASLAAAVYPGLLRFNAATAEAQQVQYQAVAPGRFEPVHQPLPEIDLSGKKLPEYWAQYPKGTEHEFTLLRGDAGFYQLDLAPFHARTREFYRRQREDR